MRFGKILHVSELKLGDVVRMIHGPAGTKPGDAADFREGYDAMTVVTVEEKYISFHRPHIEFHHDDESPRYNHLEVSVETVAMVSRDHKGLYYELLAYGPEAPSSSHWA